MTYNAETVSVLASLSKQPQEINLDYPLIVSEGYLEDLESNQRIRQDQVILFPYDLRFYRIISD